MSRILEDKDNFGSLINLPRSGFSERIEKPQRINLWAEQRKVVGGKPPRGYPRGGHGLS